MNYVGIDIHKKYSVACVQDEKGQIIRRERIEGNRVEGFQRCLKGERSRAVIEASWNWAKIYEILEGLEGLEEVVLANPLRTRLIADAQIKTDKVDAAALATLLRGNLVARAHIPDRQTRQRKQGCVSGSTGRGCARACAIASMPCWRGSTIWGFRNVRTSLAGAVWAFCEASN